MSTHILENDILKISVADAGAELCSVLDKELDTERIWTGDPTIWNRHSPILFPFVGRVTGGKDRIGNREYSMKTQHGFARDMVFTCVGESAGSVSHLLLPTEATKEIYPFDFRLLVRHSLDPENPRKILVEWQVENTGADRMYYSIGGHPGFLMPEGVRKEDCFVCFPGRDRLTCFGANGAGFALPGQTKTLTLAEGFAPYRTDIPDTWIFSGEEIETVGIAAPDRRPWVTMQCGEFPMLAVWANPAGPFICLEPWFGRTDDDGFTGTLTEKPGMETLDPGTGRHFSYSMEFHR